MGNLLVAANMDVEAVANLILEAIVPVCHEHLSMNHMGSSPSPYQSYHPLLATMHPDEFNYL